MIFFSDEKAGMEFLKKSVAGIMTSIDTENGLYYGFCIFYIMI
jgi:hypothetical protein